MPASGFAVQLSKPATSTAVCPRARVVSARFALPGREGVLYHLRFEFVWLVKFGRVGGRMYQKPINEARSSLYFPRILLPVAGSNLLSTLEIFST